MESFTAIPDYSNYLAYIFTQMPGEPENVRWRAGLTLKNNIRTGIESSSSPYLKEVIFSTSLCPKGSNVLPDISNDLGLPFADCYAVAPFVSH